MKAVEMMTYVTIMTNKRLILFFLIHYKQVPTYREF